MKAFALLSSLTVPVGGGRVYRYDSPAHAPFLPTPVEHYSQCESRSPRRLGVRFVVALHASHQTC